MFYSGILLLLAKDHSGHLAGSWACLNGTIHRDVLPVH